MTKNFKIGDKVVPHSKTAVGWSSLKDSSAWERYKRRGYLEVSSIIGDELTCDGDFFRASDLTLYKPNKMTKKTTTPVKKVVIKKPRVQKPTKEILGWDAKKTKEGFKFGCGEVKISRKNVEIIANTFGSLTQAQIDMIFRFKGVYDYRKEARDRYAYNNLSPEFFSRENMKKIKGLLLIK